MNESVYVDIYFGENFIHVYDQTKATFHAQCIYSIYTVFYVSLTPWNK